MSYFRIYIYLKTLDFIYSLLSSSKSRELKIKKKFNSFTKKKYSILTSQLRVGFVLVLKYLTKKFPKKNQVIVNSYNLEEMVNICQNLKLKIVFTKLNKNIFISEKDLIKKINKKTLAVVITNIFNNHRDILNVKKICKKNKIPLIEDNAIYFGNYLRSNRKKIYSGSFGDFSLHSFNIMKNISGMFGGLVSTNDSNFEKFALSEIKKFKNFPTLKYLKQTLIFFVLKAFSIKIFYRLFFFKMIKFAHKKNLKFIMEAIYPSLKFNKNNHFSKYLYKIHPLTIKFVDRQLSDNEYFLKTYYARMQNNLLYNKLFKKNRIKNLNFIEIKDKNFQNFNEYPIIVKDKNKLKDYLFEKGIETKFLQYIDCHKIFRHLNKSDRLNDYQTKILCLPNHIKISKNYIVYIVDCINSYYKKT